MTLRESGMLAQGLVLVQQMSELGRELQAECLAAGVGRDVIPIGLLEVLSRIHGCHD
jgi:hypothetical protein